MTIMTKNTIATVMKELTKHKSFEKITVKDITDSCGLNRQSFYYHFKDKYDLVDWIYYNEAFSIIGEDLTIDNWDDKILIMLRKIKEEHYFYESTLKFPVENSFRNHLFKLTSQFFSNTINKSVEKEIGEEEEFISEFYAYGIIGVIVSWIQDGMKESPEDLSRKLIKVYSSTEKYIIMRSELTKNRTD